MPRILNAIPFLKPKIEAPLPPPPTSYHSAALSMIAELTASIRRTIEEGALKVVQSRIQDDGVILQLKESIQDKSQSELVFLSAVFLAVVLFVILLPAYDTLFGNSSASKEGGGNKTKVIEVDTRDMARMALLRASSGGSGASNSSDDGADSGEGGANEGNNLMSNPVLLDSSSVGSHGSGGSMETIDEEEGEDVLATLVRRASKAQLMDGIAIEDGQEQDNVVDHDHVLQQNDEDVTAKENSRVTFVQPTENEMRASVQQLEDDDDDDEWMAQLDGMTSPVASYEEEKKEEEPEMVEEEEEKKEDIPAVFISTTSSRSSTPQRRKKKKKPAMQHSSSMSALMTKPNHQETVEEKTKYYEFLSYLNSSEGVSPRNLVIKEDVPHVVEEKSLLSRQQHYFAEHSTSKSDSPGANTEEESVTSDASSKVSMSSQRSNSSMSSMKRRLSKRGKKTLKKLQSSVW